MIVSFKGLSILKKCKLTEAEDHKANDPLLII